MIRDKDTHLEFYLTSGDAWAAMERDCLAAGESIELEQYILANDALGNRFLEIFAEKAKAGVKVSLMLDTVGSRGVLNSPIIESIRRHGGRVFFYNPIAWWNIFMPSTWYPRNHTKTMLIDSKAAYTGGVCLAEFMRPWRDTQVRFTGRLVDDVKRDFACLWDWAAKGKSLVRKCASQGKGLLRYGVGEPHLGMNPVYRELLSEIRRAERQISLVTPYFFPPLRLRRRLGAAARRGVQVTVIMAEETDISFAGHIAQSYIPYFLRRGIRILLYTKSTLHAKYAVIDDRWATVGSTNLDYLSLLHNREANIVATDAIFIGELARHFQNDRDGCVEATWEYLRRKPLWHRIIGRLGRPFRKLL
ncbi:MAG: phosphatidylserine/phosphatidylglycerophosphate/cardiolipin synthase family protein [Alphaproteobacteria bacterium]